MSSTTFQKRYRDNIKQIRSFVNKRFSETLNSDDSPEKIIEKLNTFLKVAGIDKDQGNQYLEKFLQIRQELKELSDDPTSDEFKIKLNEYKVAAYNLEQEAESLMNAFRGYFDNLNNQDSLNLGNKLIYLVASDKNIEKEIQVSFTDFHKIIEKDLTDAERLTLAHGSVWDDIAATTRFQTNTKLGKKNEAADYGIGEDSITNINYFLNTVINGHSKLATVADDKKLGTDVIDQIHSIISLNDSYTSKSGKTQTVNKARMVDILLGDDRLQQVSVGNWQGVLDSLTKYRDSFGTATKSEYLSKMMGENVAGALEGDATKFGAYGQYDVQIKTQLGRSSGLGLISTNMLLTNWVVFTRPELLQKVITGNFDDKVLQELGEVLGYTDSTVYEDSCAQEANTPGSEVYNQMQEACAEEFEGEIL